MTDVFPRRNLSPDAEPWGREIEKRVVNLEGVAAAAKSGVSGQNRTNAATMGDLAAQLSRIDALYRSIPKPIQVAAQVTNFGLSSGWQVIGDVNITVPAGATQANVFAIGSGYLTNTSSSVVAGWTRLMVGPTGVASPVQPWATFSDVSGFHAYFTPSYSWNLAVTEGTNFPISLQVNPSNASTWGVRSSNYAALTGMVTFTG